MQLVYGLLIHEFYATGLQKLGNNSQAPINARIATSLGGEMVP